jgi:hypothetical protein
MRPPLQVLPPKAWDMVMAEVERRLAVRPGAVQHLVVLLPVPIVYPKIPVTETVLGAISSEQTVCVCVCVCVWVGGWVDGEQAGLIAASDAVVLVVWQQSPCPRRAMQGLVPCSGLVPQLFLN